MHAVPDAALHVLAHVFKVTVDPFVGKLGVFRVHQGTVQRDSQLYVGDGRKPFKVAHLYLLQGKEHVEVPQALPGDIVAVAKVDELHFDAVLHDAAEDDHIHLAPLDLPVPVHGLAIEPEAPWRRAAAVGDPGQAGRRRPLPEGRARGRHQRDRGLRPGRAAPARAARAHARDLQASRSRPRRRASPTARPSRRRPKATTATRSRPAAPGSSARSSCASSRCRAAPASSSSTRSRAAPSRTSSSRRSKRACARCWPSAPSPATRWSTCA